MPVFLSFCWLFSGAAGQGCPLGLALPDPGTCDESDYWLFLNSSTLCSSGVKLSREHLLESEPTSRTASNDCLFFWARCFQYGWGLYFGFPHFTTEQEAPSSTLTAQVQHSEKFVLFIPLDQVHAAFSIHKHAEPCWPRSRHKNVSAKVTTGNEVKTGTSLVFWKLNCWCVPS